VVAAGIHQLQIVYHHEIEAVLAVQTAALGAQLDRGKGWRIIQKDAKPAQFVSSFDKQGPLTLIKLAAPQFV